jgi:hypothetical protein
LQQNSWNTHCTCCIYGQLPLDRGGSVSNSTLYSGVDSNNNFAQGGWPDTEEYAFLAWQHPNEHHALLLSDVTPSSFSPPLVRDDNSYPIDDLLEAFDPAIFDKPHEGRYWCYVLGCPKTFTRRPDRDRHVKSIHKNATLHFCPVPGCKKSSGKPFCRKDKLQEHMQKKHAATGDAAV